MRAHPVSMGLAFLLSLSLAQLSPGGHACCCCTEAQFHTPCVACPSACGSVAPAPCCSARAMQAKQPAHTTWHTHMPAALTSRPVPLIVHGLTPDAAQAASHHGPPLFIAHRALLL